MIRVILSLVFVGVMFLNCDALINDCHAASGNAEYISFPSTGVKLIRPDGFEDAKNFDGFQQAGTHASVIVLMMPGPFSKITAGFTAKKLKARGITLVSKKNVKIDGNQGVLLGVIQTARGKEFFKWMLAFGNEKNTRMVMATFPKALKEELSAQLKSVVMSARLDDATPPNPGTGLPFAMAASDKLKLTPGTGKMLVYTKNGVVPAKSPDDPLFIAAQSLHLPPNLQDKRRFATQRIFQTANTKIKSITSTNAITIDGLDGYESLADAKDVATGRPLVVYQVILFEKDSYIIMQGLVGTKYSAEYLPEFKAMARSFKRKRR